MCSRSVIMSDIKDDDDENSLPNEISVKKEIGRNDVHDQDVKRNLEVRIMNACMMGYLEVIEEYLEQSNINEFLHTGWTPLLYAASFVQSGIIEHLLAFGADPNKHKDGFTPIMAVCSSTKATHDNSLKSLMLLIQAKADVNTTNMHRETALMYACKSQNSEIIMELVKHVKNINACDSDGKTALSYAVVANKPDIVKILLKHNADISLTDKYNLTAKDIADTKGFVEISALLADNNEEILTVCQISQIMNWKDLFSDLYPKNEKVLDYDISVILHGMGLEKYCVLFQGIDLKTFLQLTEDDLYRLGIDITVHRDQFLDKLENFHSKRWHTRSIGIIEKSRSYTIYDGVISLGNVKKQIGVIASGFQYIKNNLLKAATENIYLTPVEKTAYRQELRKTQRTLKILKREMINVKRLAQKIDNEYNIGVPATFINFKRNKTRWTVALSITLIIGLYSSRIIYKN